MQPLIFNAPSGALPTTSILKPTKNLPRAPQNISHESKNALQKEYNKINLIMNFLGFKNI